MAKTAVTQPTAAAAPTNILSTLKISTAKRSANVDSATPAARARDKACEGIVEQLKYANAELAGGTYEATRTKYVAGPDGKRVKVEAPKRALRWYWKGNDGPWQTEIRYGSSAIHLPGGGSAIECGSSLDEVVKILSSVAEAIRQGELDVELARLAARRIGSRKRA